MIFAMDIIQQTLVVKEWPLKQVGDERFFGYVVAVGVFPRDWSEEGMFAYADFACNDSYCRYRLPKDENLLSRLIDFLWGNTDMCRRGEGIYGKVWVKLTDQGYQVHLP
jgi:hypothetical protein